jgi:hypothetical protein
VHTVRRVQACDCIKCMPTSSIRQAINQAYACGNSVQRDLNLEIDVKRVQEKKTKWFRTVTAERTQ